MPNRPERIYSLDVLRGIAALSVVFWHWQHFFYIGAQPVNFDMARQPFFDALSLFYRHGSLAVELFFVISGFVFFWLFSRQIDQRDLPAKQFFMDRFSRLYPLHIATFLLVLGLQWVFTQRHSEPFVYAFNDGYHALLNVLLMPAWGFEAGWSFNAPVWSVSVECLLYALFFLICLTGKFRYPLAACLLITGYMIYPLNYKLGSGLLCFFSGGLAFLAMQVADRLFTAKIICAVTLLLSVLAWTLVATTANRNNYFIMGVAFPLGVMFIASLSWQQPGLMKSWAMAGDLSYSSYLLHFPLQILFVMAAERFGYGREVFYSPWMLLLFMAILIPLSLACHRVLEVPVQRALRARFRTWSKRQSAL
ncbi:acyltransferase [Pseudomonas sp. 3A(2025)]